MSAEATPPPATGHRGHPRRPHRISRVLTLMAAATAMVLLAAGCSDDDDGSSEPSSTTAAPDTSEAPAPTDPTETTEAPSTPTDPVDPAPAGPVDHLGAIAIALETTPGTAIEIGRGNERGQAVWEVLVRRDDGSGIEHYIAIDTGEVLRQDAESVPSIASTSPAVSLEEALDIATGTVAGSEVIEADLGTEGSLTVWEVVVRSAGQQTELYIDAATGEVVKQELDD